jgi:hypothetical protein
MIEIAADRLLPSCCKLFISRSRSLFQFTCNKSWERNVKQFDFNILLPIITMWVGHVWLPCPMRRDKPQWNNKISLAHVQNEPSEKILITQLMYLTGDSCMAQQQLEEEGRAARSRRAQRVPLQWHDWGRWQGTRCSFALRRNGEFDFINWSSARGTIDGQHNTHRANDLDMKRFRNIRVKTRRGGKTARARLFNNT